MIDWQSDLKEAGGRAHENRVNSEFVTDGIGAKHVPDVSIGGSFGAE